MQLGPRVPCSPLTPCSRPSSIPLTRCGARAAVKVTGRTAQRRTEHSGPCTEPPPLVPHTSRPPECNVTERQGGTPPPQGSVRAQVAGSRQGKGKHPQHPQHSKRIHGIGAPRQHPSSRREKQQVSSARGSPELGINRAPPEPLQPPPKVFPPGFPGQQVSPTRAAPAPTCVRRGLHAGGPGARRPDSGPLLLVPALPRPVPRPLGRPRRRTRPRLSEPLPSPPPPPGLISHSGAGTPTPPGRRRHHRVAMETLCPPPPAHSHTLAGAQPLRTGRLLA